MEKVRIRKIIEDIIITQFLNSEMDIVHEEDVTFKELRCLSGKTYKNGDKANIKYEEGELSI